IYNIKTTLLYFVFFFQAEDGIRDFHVTGVQTCALPILQNGHATASVSAPVSAASRARSTLICARTGPTTRPRTRRSRREPRQRRSEERRVGKGCRAAGTA